MADSDSAGEQCKDFRHETLVVSKELERMTEQMESISVDLSWMAYDMVALRSDPKLAKSLQRLKNEFIQCKGVICGSRDDPVDQSTPADQKEPQE